MLFRSSKIYISDSTTLGQVNEFYKQYNHHSGIPYYNNNINITRYDYSPNNIDMPLYLGYKINRIEFEIGVNISILKFTNTSETYSNGSILSQNAIGNTNQSDYTIVYPMLRIGYSLMVKRITIIPYVAITFYSQDQNDYYLEAGIKIPFIKLN